MWFVAGRTNRITVGLISAVDSKAMVSGCDRRDQIVIDRCQPKATALLYTSRTLGGTLGVSLGSSVQIGVLGSTLRSRFASIPNCDEVCFRRNSL